MKLMYTAAFLIMLAVIGYAGYTYIKQDPPDVLIDAVTQTQPPPPLPEGEVAPLQAPEGFVATIFSRETPSARVLTLDPKGTLLVSLTSQGQIIALPDFDSNGVADETRTILSGLDRPHGIYVHCENTGFESASQDACTLFVAETDVLKSYTYDADLMRASNEKLLATLPQGGGGHFTRTLLMHPNGEELLLSIGSSCNVCEESDERRATVMSYNLQSQELTPYATGLRNTVFMATDPVTGAVWGTDNGRDLIGDDIPPDEVNLLQEGGDYGWPYCYGENVYDTDFNRKDESACESTLAPHIALQAHSAALGLAFVPEEGWPEDMRNDLLVAYHGSWNRSEPTGYKVVRFDLNPQETRDAQSGAIDFLTGFLQTSDTNDAIGRPVAILTQPGGIAYITDDRAGAVYKIVYTREVE